jgi:hypothetical protein
MSCDATQHDWDILTSYIQRAPRTFTHDLPVLVMGDMNAHDSLWDLSLRESDSDIGGRHLSSFLSEPDDWHLLNTLAPESTPTHYPNRPGARPSVLDLAISNDFNLIESFHVLHEDMLASDHQPIMCTIHTNGQDPNTPQRYIWRTSRDDIPWDIFRSMLSLLLASWQNKWAPYLSHEAEVTQLDIDTCWHELRNIITCTLQPQLARNRSVSITNIGSLSILSSLHYIARTYSYADNGAHTNRTTSQYQIICNGHINTLVISSEQL